MPYTPENQYDNGKTTDWRCTSYYKWVILQFCHLSFQEGKKNMGKSLKKLKTEEQKTSSLMVSGLPVAALVWVRQFCRLVCRTLKPLHPGRLTWNIQITHLERKMIFQTSMIMFHVNLQECKTKTLGRWNMKQPQLPIYLGCPKKNRKSLVSGFDSPNIPSLFVSYSYNL